VTAAGIETWTRKSGLVVRVTKLEAHNVHTFFFLPSNLWLTPWNSCFKKLLSYHILSYPTISYPIPSYPTLPTLSKYFKWSRPFRFPTNGVSYTHFASPPCIPYMPRRSERPSRLMSQWYSSWQRGCSVGLQYIWQTADKHPTISFEFQIYTRLQTTTNLFIYLLIYLFIHLFIF
jgi:hypothetical protein